MCFAVAGATLGEGDVPLRECYEILQKHAPNPDTLVMEIEMIAPADLDPRECLRLSACFVNSLRGIAV